MDAWERELDDDAERFFRAYLVYRDSLAGRLTTDERLDRVGQQIFAYLAMRGVSPREARRRAMDGNFRVRQQVRDEASEGYKRDKRLRWRQLFPSAGELAAFDVDAGEQLGFWLRRLTSPDFVYMIQHGANGPVKIGLSNKPQRRVGQLQTGNPEELRLRHVFPANRNVEAGLHVRFKDARIRGEWFGGREYLPIILALGSGLAEKAIRSYDGSGRPPSILGVKVMNASELRRLRRLIFEAIMDDRLSRAELLERFEINEDELDVHLDVLWGEDISQGERRAVTHVLNQSDARRRPWRP